MARKKKEQKEKYIKVRISKITGLTTYQVFIEPSARSADERYTASFAERDYGSKEDALKAAIRDRKRVLDLIDITGMITTNKKRTLTEVFEEMIKISGYANSTVMHYKGAYKKAFQSSLGGIDIRKITALSLQKCVMEFQHTTQSRIQNIETVAKRTFEHAKKHRYIDTNPFDFYTPVKSKKIHKPKNQVLEVGDFEKVLDYLATPVESADYTFQNISLRYALLCMSQTGFRPSEVFALEKKDFDFEKRIVTNHKAVDSVLKDGKPQIKTTKSEAGVRTSPMTDTLFNEMKKWFQAQSSHLAFPDYKNNQFTISKISNKIFEIAQKLGVNFNMYQLRHNFATILVTNNVDPRTVQELMGHSDFNMSVYYARSNDDIKREAIKKIEITS